MTVDPDDFDPLDPAAAPEDIDEALAAFRGRCPVYLPRADAYLVASAEHVDAVGKRGDLFSAWTTTGGASRDLDRAYQVRSPLFDQDPDTGHTAVRRALQPHFTPRAARRWQEYMRELTRKHMAQLWPVGRCDAVAEIAYQLPWMLTGALLGVREPHRFTYRDLAMAHFLGGDDSATAAFDEFLRGVIQSKRRDPGEDLISTVMATVDEHGRCPTDAEITRFAKIMSGAGSLTSADSVASILLHLERDRELRARVIAEPQLLPQLVDEIARTQAAVAVSGRRVRQRTTLGGVQLEADDQLLMCWYAAARDDAAHEQADRVRLDRRLAAHAGWGRGDHRCLGRDIAMVSLPAMVQEVLAAIPDYRLVPGATPVRTFGNLRGVDRLEIEWDVVSRGA